MQMTYPCSTGWRVDGLLYSLIQRQGGLEAVGRVVLPVIRSSHKAVDENLWNKS